MLMIKLLRNDNLLNAEFALNQANCGNIIELCRAYIKLLNEYRDGIYKLRGTPEINLFQTSPLARELVEQTRKSIRAAIEITTRERNHIEFLLKSFTAISGYEAIKTFNQLEYKGFTGWELRANHIRVENDENNERLTVQQAVEAASLLRREAYLKNKTTFFAIPA